MGEGTGAGGGLLLRSQRATDSSWVEVLKLNVGGGNHGGAQHITLQVYFSKP